MTAAQAELLDDTSTRTPDPANQRIFKIGDTIIYDDDTTRSLPLAEVQALLALSYPELQHVGAAYETPQPDGSRLVEWLSVPGRKG